MPIPKAVLQEIVSYYSRSPERPDGLSLDDPFALPAAFARFKSTAVRPSSCNERSAADEVLATPLQFLKGVGPRRAADFEHAGLITLEDLLYRFPIRYEDRSRLQPIASLKPGQTPSPLPAAF